METIRLALVDDQKLFRQSLAVLLTAVPGHELVMEAENGTDCLSKLKSMPLPPHIILLDMEMPEMNGVELNEELQKNYPGIKRIILSVFAKERLIARMINAGACGYLIKNCNKEELYTAIQSVFEKGFYMNAQIMRAIQNSSAHSNNVIMNLDNMPIELTARETEILRYICKEYSNAEIASELFLSIRTVEGHRNNLLSKTRCKNTAGLTLFAVKYKIFDVVF